jgi:glycosyltransferase involved in cell wall biosynthesis
LEYTAPVSLKFLFLEPFWGGSHKDFAQGLISHSRHRIDIVSLPARYWKWRMRGAALHFMGHNLPLKNYDGLIVTDLMSLADFKALAGSSCPPTLTYFHENQLTYPLAPGETMDFQYGFTDITTALSAECVVFNSKYHFKSFFSTLPGFLGMMPEYRPIWAVQKIRDKSTVLYPGCRFPSEKKGPTFSNAFPPLILWNHRWEFDKNPKAFFDAIDAVSKRGLDFQLALLGEDFRNVPDEFITARRRYGDRIVHYGYVKKKNTYFWWLSKASIVISTSNQENFGVSVVEAIRHGCLPLLPKRLVYPEIIPKAFQGDFLYEDQADLVEKLALAISNYLQFREKIELLSDAMGMYAWDNLIDAYDAKLQTMALKQKK